MLIGFSSTTRLLLHESAEGTAKDRWFAAVGLPTMIPASLAMYIASLVKEGNGLIIAIVGMTVAVISFVLFSKLNLHLAERSLLKASLAREVVRRLLHRNAERELSGLRSEIGAAQHLITWAAQANLLPREETMRQYTQIGNLQEQTKAAWDEYLKQAEAELEQITDFS